LTPDLFVARTALPGRLRSGDGGGLRRSYLCEKSAHPTDKAKAIARRRSDTIVEPVREHGR